MAASAHFNEATDENVRGSLAALPTMLRRIDDWIAAGILNGEQLNAADYQIAPSLRLAMTLEDLRPVIESRPAGEMAKRVVPHYPGKAPPILPPAWLQPLRSEPLLHSPIPAGVPLNAAMGPIPAGVPLNFF